MASVLMDSFNVAQDRISRSRLAGDPPDIFIRGWLEGVGLFDFHRAADLIEAGRQAARRARHDLEYIGVVPCAAE
jgi:NTE family protein